MIVALSLSRSATAYPAAIARRIVLPVAVATAALCAAVGAAAGDPPAPKVKRVQCLAHCAGVRQTTVGGKVRLEGHHLAGVTAVTFDGDPVEVVTAPDSTDRRRVVVTVPGGAVTGRPTVTAGADTDRSPQPVRIVDASELPDGFHLTDARARPKHAFIDERRGIRLHYRFKSAERTSVRIEVVRRHSGQTIRSWHKEDQLPFPAHSQTWDGLEADGDAANDGRYRFKVGPIGGPASRAGAVKVHGYRFPVRGPHGYGGYLQSFGAPRSGGRTHQGQDVLASCGTRLDAARGGTVQRADYDPQLYGNYVVIDGYKTKADFMYAHMVSPSRFGNGDRVHTGERIGSVGKTGNARTTPCHLHFEIWPHGWRRGSPIDPKPSLLRWDGWS